MKNSIDNRVLCITALTILISFVSIAAEADVRFAPQLERGPGAGYNAKHYDRRVAQPKSILKRSAANRAVHDERRFNRQLGSRTRATMRHRGDVARHTRRGAETRATLSNRARAQVRFNTEPRRAGSGYNNARYDRRVGQPKSILKNSRANRAIASERRFNQRLGSSTRATMRHRGDVARHARHSAKYKSTLSNTGRAARHARTASRARTAAKFAARGAGAYAATYAFEQTVGVDIPDAVDAAEWSYHTLRDPKNADKRFAKLGRDAEREFRSGVNTITNPKKMASNVDRTVRKTGKSIEKGACSVGKLFGAKC